MGIDFLDMVKEYVNYSILIGLRLRKLGFWGKKNKVENVISLIDKSILII